MMNSDIERIPEREESPFRLLEEHEIESCVHSFFTSLHPNHLVEWKIQPKGNGFRYKISQEKNGKVSVSGGFKKNPALAASGKDSRDKIYFEISEEGRGQFKEEVSQVQKNVNRIVKAIKDYGKDGSGKVG